MDWKLLFQKLDTLVDAANCMEKTAAIYENDRWCTTSKNAETAQYCAEVFRNAGLDQVELLPLAADSKTKYFDWSVAKAWDADYGILQYDDGELISDYHKMPCSLVMYCPSTPAEGIEAEVIEITDADYTMDLEDESLEAEIKKRYQGKVLLTARTAYQGVEFAEKVGAVGVLSDFITILPGVRDSRNDLYDECVWMGMGPSNTSSVFAFHLTPRQADEMRSRLAKDTVRVFAKVSTRSYEGTAYTVSAALTGTEPELPEVLTYGHLYEPGANDNASGSGAILALAETFGNAVRNGVLPRPKRTIRFVAGYECGGSMGYLASHSDRDVLCGIVADMIGAEATDRAVMSLRYDPLSNWSYADAALWSLCRIAQEHFGKEIPYNHMSFNIGTDNIIADPCFHMPTVAMVAAPALSYHSSMDRVNRVDPETLKRNALIFGTFLLGFAYADEKTCSFLEEAIRAQIAELCAKAGHEREKVQLLEAQERAIKSLSRITGQPAAAPSITSENMPAYALTNGSRIPVRTMKGALTFSGVFQGKTWAAAWNRKLNLPYFWVDGARTFWEVVYQSAIELGASSDEALRAKYEELTDYFDCLTANGYIEWKKK